MLIETMINAQGLPADCIIQDGTIHTMDARYPVAQSVAIYRDRIVAVGNNEEIQRLRGPQTRIISAKGRLVLPGFNDAHVHFLSGGFQLSNVDLRNGKSPQEMAALLQDYRKAHPDKTWITGGDWDHEQWAGSPLPTKNLIDPVSSDFPVFVTRLDGHMGLANSKALKMAGIDRNTADPPGGMIVRDEKTGEPTGILKDSAMDLVTRLIPNPSHQEKIAALIAASQYAASLGVTSIQDMSAGGDLKVYRDVLAQGKLLTRIYAMNPLSSVDQLSRIGVDTGFGDPFIRIGGLKAFSDGSLGSTTAWFFEPYQDAPQTCGLPAAEFLDRQIFNRHLNSAYRAGLQCMIHAIGDRANSELLSSYENLSSGKSMADRRYRVEHAQHLRQEDIKRFAKLGIIASMQPYHCADDGRWAEKRIGKERCKGTYAFRSLIDSGVQLAFGSDWTVAPLNPLLGIAAAVTRQTLDGKNPQGWIPEQKISIEQAVRAYTLGSAYAEFQENEKGSITPGKLADLIILDQDIFQINPNQIAQSRVILTMSNGKIVFDFATQ